MNPVFALVERDGRARSFHMPNVRGENLHAVLEARLAKEPSHDRRRKRLVAIGWNFASHGTVNHSKDEYVRMRGTVITTNTVEGFFDPETRYLRRLSACQRSPFASLFD